MLHTIKTDYSQHIGKQLIKELQKNKHSILADSITAKSAPEGYIKLEDFRKEVKVSAKKILKEY
ncbi:MAG: hypothetical protein PHV20_12810 [Bacteroidales bacterium]|nr:hypothetical protein [Bacteroidales bacterium]